MSLVLTHAIRARVVFTLCLLLLCPAPRASAQTAAGLSAEKVKQIEALVSAEMAWQRLPGLSVAVVTDRRLRWSNGYGLADVENNVPAKAATVYRLASVSKPITATAVMQLFEREKVDLDAPVQRYCPAFPVKQWPITTRQLLGHLSGIRHYKSEEEVNSTRHYDTTAEALSMFKDDPLLHEPGTKMTYTTFGYTLLGCVVEGASGEKFTDYLRENVFAPAGMSTARADSVADIIPNRAQGYRRTEGGELKNSALADTSYKIPGGGLVSTVEDLAKFAVAVETYKLLKRETTEQMFTSRKTSDGKETGYGLGWGVGAREGRRAIGHSGAQKRVSTVLITLPDQGAAVVIMANVEDARLEDLALRISDALLK
jgi:serine beta-lactamase-like protein LACTB, mitochondrial